MGHTSREPNKCARQAYDVLRTCEIQTLGGYLSGKR